MHILALRCNSLQIAMSPLQVGILDENSIRSVSSASPFCASGDDALPDKTTWGENADRKKALQCFQYLLLFTAALESFAHGANDTANSTGPFSAVLAIYQTGLDTCDSIKTHVRAVLSKVYYYCRCG